MKSKRKILSTCLIVGVIAAFALCFFSTANTFSKLKTSAVADAHSEVTLASANRKASLTLPVSYWRQTSDPCGNQYDAYRSKFAKSRQFEWTKCGYYRESLEKGIVSFVLGPDGLPVFSRSGELITNRGIDEESFYRWFHNTAESTYESNFLQFEYSSDDDSYRFESQKFWPFNEDLFTMSVVIPFYADDSGQVSITADDDTWIFLNDELIIDLGGVHRPISEVYELQNEGVLRIFHANRDSRDSVLSFQLSHARINTSDPLIAGNDDYIKPLGETSSYNPGHSRAIVATITIEFCVLMVLVLVTPFIIKFALKRR